jgi:CHAT domain-containing protein
MKFVRLTSVFLFLSSFIRAQTLEELNEQLSDFYAKGDYKNAISIAKKALEVTTKDSAKFPLDYANCLNNLGALYVATGEYKKVESLYQEAMLIRKKILGKTHPDYATSINNLAFFYANTDRHVEAVILYKEALEVLKPPNLNIRSYATTLNNLALLYYNIGQYKEAEPIYIQSLTIRKYFGEKDPDYVLSLNNLAELYRSMGQYEKAAPLFLKVLTIRRIFPGENHIDYATSLNNLAELYRNVCQYEKAEPLYVKAISIWRNAFSDSNLSYAVSLNNLANLYENMGQFEKAELFQIKALDVRKKAIGVNHSVYAHSLMTLAGLYTKTERYHKARPLCIEALEILKKMGNEKKTEYANCLNILGVTYFKAHQYEKAESLFIEAMSTRKTSLGERHPDYVNSLNNLSDFYQNMAQYEKAGQLLLQVNKVTAQNLIDNFSILSENEKNKYITRNISLLEANNALAYHFKKVPSYLLKNNFDHQIFFKSIILNDTRNILESVQQRNDTTLLRLLNEWNFMKSILANQYSLPLKNRRVDLGELEEKTEDLEKELSRRSSEFQNEQRTFSISLQDVQQNLQQDEAAIEFVRFGLYNKKRTDSIIYAAYILKKNDSIPVFVPLCEEKQLQQLFDKAGKTSTSMVRSLYRGGEVTNTSGVSLGTDLYKLVWEPLEPYLKGVKKISYSPAGKLYSIAFHALRPNSTKMLMDKYRLTQYTSTRQVALRTSENQITKPTSIILFGNASFTMDSLQIVKQKTNQREKENISTSIYTPQKRSSNNNTWNNLPGTAEEVNKIKQLFDKNKINSKSFVQTTASEENLKALNGNSPQILHIATHGFFLPEPGKKKNETGFDQGNTYSLADDPLLRSGLILAGGNYAWSGKIPIEGVEDGVATAYEISQLNLNNTELVVLSACETALGDVKGSEGVFGLQRAFKMAGVKKMIVSLWQVPDKETAELMTSFYSYWMKGKSVSQSFTQAQADMRKKYAPFYWAAFVLVE